MTPSEFETFLRIAREQKVFAFKINPNGEMAVQFMGEMDPGTSLVERPDSGTAGGWKRDPDLDHDPELDKQTEWD